MVRTLAKQNDGSPSNKKKSFDTKELIKKGEHLPPPSKSLSKKRGKVRQNSVYFLNSKNFEGEKGIDLENLIPDPREFSE